MTPEALVDRLNAAVDLSSNDAGIRIRQTLNPAGGAETKIFPPTYSDITYVLEERYRQGSEQPTKTVLLDAQQSQANRCEDALNIAIADGAFALPHLRISATVEGWSIAVTNLTAPHRGPDAYFRDSEDGSGKAFDQTAVGEALRRADSGNATAFFENVPSDLILGFWDSQRGGRGTKIARSYTSEIIGWNPIVGERAAGKVDPNNIEKLELSHPDKKPGEYVVLQEGDKLEKGHKKAKPSSVGHGNIPPSPQRNKGVVISDAERLAYLSFAGLNRLRFPATDGGRTAERNTAARTVLACLALYADRLAFDRPALLLRSGCELIVATDQLQWVDRRNNIEEFDLSTASARAAYDIALERAKRAGFTWDTNPFELRPKKNLTELLAATFTKYADIDE